LGNNGVQEKGIAQIIAGVAKSREVTHLTIKSNELGSAAMKALAVACIRRRAAE
jgi:hypothetical protein